jgi:hypothetical protein
VALSVEERKELLDEYENMVAECDGHWEAGRKSDDYESMSAKEKSIFDNDWRKDKRKKISEWLEKHKIRPLLNKQELRAYVQKIIMESQKEMDNSTDMLDKLKNKVFENLERRVVVQRPETHVYEKGKEPKTDATDSDINDVDTQSNLLEDKFGQQVLSALRYL